jgi:Divergent InlB B-repeat domain
VRRLTILLAALGALLLLPAAQALASGNAYVNIVGKGSGGVSSVGGVAAFESEEEFWNEYFDEFGNIYEGSPPIECTYPPQAGTCETPLVEDVEGIQSIALRAIPAPGSEFRGWTVEEGSEPQIGCEEGGNATAEGENPKYCLENGGGGNVKVTVAFCLEGQSLEACLASGATNLRDLTITKSPSSSTGGGNGSVSSKPKGIKCGATCDEAVAAMYKETPVELTAKPSTGSTFVKWENEKEGGACDGSTNAVCTVPMAEDESLQAVFGGTSKAFSPAEALTVSKGESSGKGTVKGPGLGCEADCSSTVVLYQGPITEPKPKAGKTVVLKQAPAFGSVFSGWTGCDSVTEAGECVVEMDEAHAVSAEYTALPNKALTINKAYAKGNGSVSSKPKGIKCGTTCTQAVAQMPEGASVELTAKPSTGTFVKWSNPGGDCNESTSTTCVVGMDKDETIEAVFSDPGKAIAEAKTLTLNKAGSGFGTVKAAGLGCELLCSSTSVLYTGPITEPKAKPGKTVVLKAVSAPGSQKVKWSGCDSVTEAGECVVEMDENHSVTATFDELE